MDLNLLAIFRRLRSRLPPLRPLTYRRVARKLMAAGFFPVDQRGSHVKFAKTTVVGDRRVIVPRHREVQTGTLRSILRQAGLSRDEFERL
ncbi:MAG: type II toxin-antitoxin system HicA family toxin [Chloroflexi bacterium]|nr:type II toxin-antitoxin system HicA family toxin [Chloroflexota bacterium]